MDVSVFYRQKLYITKRPFSIAMLVYWEGNSHQYPQFGWSKFAWINIKSIETSRKSILIFHFRGFSIVHVESSMSHQKIIQIFMGKPAMAPDKVSLRSLGGGRLGTLHQHAAEGLVDGGGHRGVTVAGRSMASRRQLDEILTSMVLFFWGDLGMIWWFHGDLVGFDGIW